MSAPTREDAYKLLTEFNKNESLIKHALSVEAVMKHFAVMFGEEPVEKWAIIGLIHDLDYEMYPEQHCKKSGEILTERGWPADYVHAVVSHGWGICSDVEPVERMEKMLYATDELTGLVAATAMVRPSKSIYETEPKSVLKKWKQKGFAAGVNREVIEKGAAALDMPLEQMVEETVKAMTAVAESIGLKGNIAQ